MDFPLPTTLVFKARELVLVINNTFLTLKNETSNISRFPKYSVKGYGVLDFDFSLL